MKPRFLFPYKSRYVGIGLILLHIPIMYLWQTEYPGAHHGVFAHGSPSRGDDAGLFSAAHIFFIIISLLMLIGLFLIAFSKEKIEDEQITQLRLESLQWSIYLNYLILLLTIIFTSDIDYIDMLRLNLWVPLVFFIARFRWVIYRLKYEK